MYLNWWDTASRISEPTVFGTHISDLQNVSGCVEKNNLFGHGMFGGPR